MRWRAALLLWFLPACAAMAADLPEAPARSAFVTPGATSVLLGRDLFFDPVLSGSRDTSCASCHRGAQGTRSLTNLGSDEVGIGRHHGRVLRDPDARFGLRLPPGQHLERPVSPLAAQVLMALVAEETMTGPPDTNAVAREVAAGRITGLQGAWQTLAARVAAIPAYRRRFAWIIGPDEPLHITDVATALADFIAYEFRATDTPLDVYLAGGTTALSAAARRGMQVFHGAAGCATCHAGPFLSDGREHATASGVARTARLRNVMAATPRPQILTLLARHPGADRLRGDTMAAILAYLDALTDPAAGAGRLGPPDTVPSGLETGGGGTGPS